MLHISGNKMCNNKINKMASNVNEWVKPSASSGQIQSVGFAKVDFTCDQLIINRVYFALPLISSDRMPQFSYTRTQL